MPTASGATVRGKSGMAQHDINEAKSTYESFISMTKVSMVIIALVVAFVVLIIQ